MNKKLIFNFFKDRLNIFGLFAFNSIILIVFFNFEEGTRQEIVYPLILSSFSLALLLITEGYKYFGFNRNLDRVTEAMATDLKPVTSEQKKINGFWLAALEKHTGELNKLKLESKNRNYFLSQWIHNLKTPISVIDLIIQKAAYEEKDLSEVMDSIREENQRLYNRVEQLLTITRLEDFERDYGLQSLNLVEAIKKLLHSRRRQFILSGVLPELTTEAEEMLVLSDKKWNEHMLEQVISNAIKYSKEEEKSKKVFINISRREDKTILSIRDEGIGIPNYDINRVFDAFFTGENGRLHRDSSGIGLFITSEIANRLGHEISITSELHKGTEVTFSYITKL